MCACSIQAYYGEGIRVGASSEIERYTQYRYNQQITQMTQIMILINFVCVTLRNLLIIEFKYLPKS
jgi:hypothetical protein